MNNRTSGYLERAAVRAGIVPPHGDIGKPPSERMTRQGAAVAGVYHPPIGAAVAGVYHPAVDAYAGHTEDALISLGPAPRWGFMEWAFVAVVVGLSLGAIAGIFWSW